MSVIEGKIRTSWETGGAILGAALAAILSFQHLGDISLDARFFLVALAGVLLVVFVARIVHLGPKQRSPKSKAFVPLILLGALAMVAASGASTFLLIKTVSFHNIRIFQKTGFAEPNVGQIEVQPAHMPTTLTLTLSTPQFGPTILQEAPRNWNGDDEVEWRMQDESPHGVTLYLTNFKSPQVFGIWYKLSGQAQQLHIQAGADPGETNVLRERQVSVYLRRIWMFGGGLCIAGIFYWVWLSYWVPNTKQSD